MADVSSWFIDQLNDPATEPKRVFTMANSDHSARVQRWPTIKRDIEELKPVNTNIALSNIDQVYNEFHNALYTVTASCHIDIGFTHPESGDELVRVYTGIIEKVKYEQQKCKVYIKDKIYDLSLRNLGSTESHIDFSSQIPSDIAWTLCTCYGGLSTVASTSNTDIDYDAFNTWAATFSADTVETTANFQGEVITEGLAELCKYTDSFAWVNGQGQVVFERFNEVSSLDFLVEEGEYKSLRLEIDVGALVNRQYVDYNYAVGSDYWQNQVTETNSTSVNSYRLHENVLQSPNVWFTSSGFASNLASRMVTRLASPPKHYSLNLPLFGLHREPGNTIRLISSFYNVSSGSGFRVSEQTMNLDNFTVKVRTNNALVASGFYLDSSDLDGTDILL